MDPRLDKAFSKLGQLVYKRGLISEEIGLLVDKIEQIKAKTEQADKHTVNEPDENALIFPCGVCGGQLIRKFNHKDQKWFYGCSNYKNPILECEHTISIAPDGRLLSTNEISKWVTGKLPHQANTQYEMEMMHGPLRISVEEKGIGHDGDVESRAGNRGHWRDQSPETGSDEDPGTDDSSGSDDGW